MTEQEDLDTLAAEYVLGLMGGAFCERVEARLKAEPELAQRVAFWRRRLAPLDGGAKPVAPMSESWTRLKARVAVEPSPAARGPLTIRSDEGVWEARGPGVDTKLLSIDPETNAKSYLLRFAPGAELGAHAHLIDEECFMISGEATVGDLHLKAGDYHLIPKHMAHGRGYSKTGALIFVRGRVASG